MDAEALFGEESSDSAEGGDASPMEAVGASLSRLTSKPKTYLGRQMISRREYK